MRYLLHATLTVSLSGAALLAQQARPDGTATAAAIPDLRVPIHTAESDAGLAYGLWAAGAAYKASFHGDVTFVPYLGADYPTTRSLAWRTESIAVGSDELLAAAPLRSHGDYRFELCSPAVIEAYDVRLDGLEQTFVFARRPNASGDLVVTGRVATALTAEPFAGQQRAVEFFDDDGRAILTYGAGTVVDASGREGAVLTSFDGERVTLRVAGDWLESAAYPVVLDPLLYNTVVTTGTPRSSPDVTWDSQTDNVFFCCTLAASATDYDCLAVMLTGGFGTQAVVFSDISTVWSTPECACAVAGVAPRRFGLVLRRTLPSVGERLRAHLHDPAMFQTNNSVFPLDPPNSSYNDWRVDIGGCDVSTSPFNPSGRDFLVVRQRDVAANPINTDNSSIVARTLSASGVLGSEVVLAAGSPLTSDFDRPSVTQQSTWTGGNNGRNVWMVTYQRCPTSGVGAGTYWRMNGVLVDHTGARTYGLDYGGPAHQYVTPEVAGQNGRYLVFMGHSTFAQVGSKSNSELAYNVRALRVDWDWGQPPTLPHAIQEVSVHTVRHMLVGSVAYDSDTRSHWTVTYTDLRTQAGFGGVYAVRLGYTGAVVESEIAAFPSTGSSEGIPGGICYDNFSGQYVVGSAMNIPGVGNPTGQGEVVRYVYPASGVPQASGTACSAGAIGWTGSLNTGSEFSFVRLTNAPSNQLAFLVAALQPQNLDLSGSGLPGCFLLVAGNGQPGFLGTATAVTSASGAASFNIKLPEWLGQIDFYFQWFHLAPGPTFESTQRLLVRIVP